MDGSTRAVDSTTGMMILDGCRVPVSWNISKGRIFLAPPPSRLISTGNDLKIDTTTRIRRARILPSLPFSVDFKIDSLARGFDAVKDYPINVRGLVWKIDSTVDFGFDEGCSKRISDYRGVPGIFVEIFVLRELLPWSISKSTLCLMEGAIKECLVTVWYRWNIRSIDLVENTVKEYLINVFEAWCRYRRNIGSTAYGFGGRCSKRISD